MIFINQQEKNDSCGSGRFTFALWEAIHPKFAKHFDNETMQDFENDLDFQKMLWLVDLSNDDFNFVAQVIAQTKLDKVWQDEKAILLDLLALDKRFEAEPA